jgi:hypothetical protein
MSQITAARTVTRVDLFDAAYRGFRVYKGIREAATEALQDVIGPTKVTPILGGYSIVCGEKGVMAGDNENEFLESARRLASQFRK